MLININFDYNKENRIKNYHNYLIKDNNFNSIQSIQVPLYKASNKLYDASTVSSRYELALYMFYAKHNLPIIDNIVKFYITHQYKNFDLQLLMKRNNEYFEQNLPEVKYKELFYPEIKTKLEKYLLLQ